MIKSGNKVVGIAALLVAGMVLSMPQVASAAKAAPAPESFKALDANGDGLASVDEATAAHITTDAFVAADKNKDGMLDADEYVAAGMTPVVDSKSGKATN